MTDHNYQGLRAGFEFSHGVISF